MADINWAPTFQYLSAKGLIVTICNVHTENMTISKAFNDYASVCGILNVNHISKDTYEKLAKMPPEKFYEEFKEYKDEFSNEFIKRFITKEMRSDADYKNILSKHLSVNNILDLRNYLANHGCSETADIYHSLNLIIAECKTSEKCPKCGKPLFISDVEEYTYVCPDCDENFG